MVDYIGFIPYLIKALQEQNELIKDLQQQVEQLQDSSILGQTGVKAGGNRTLTTSFLRIKPNPTSTDVTITYNFLKEISGAQVRIMDMDGNMVYEADVTDAHGEISVATNSFKNGLYIISLVSNGSVWETKRLLISR